MHIIYVDDEYEYGLTYLCFYVDIDGSCVVTIIDVIGRGTEISDVTKKELLQKVTRLCVSPSHFVHMNSSNGGYLLLFFNILLVIGQFY